MDWRTPLKGRPPLSALGARRLLPAVLAWVPLFSAFAQGPPPEDSLIDPTAALSEWRQIGIKRSGNAPCPDPGHPWATRHLFGANAFDWMPLPPRLRPFCLYELAAPGPATFVETSLLSSLGLARIEPDAMALTSQGLDLATSLFSTLEDRFLDQAGAVDELPFSPNLATRLAIVDTSPDAGMNTLGEPESSVHGAALQRLAAALLCDSHDRCLAEVSPRLALAYLTFDPVDRQSSRRDPIHGGFLGLLGELAEAVVREVEAWQGEGQPRGLVLNLSIGWNGALFGGLEAQVALMPPPVQAVYQALEHAACEGALAIAAAGNQDGLRELSPGPLLPAAWEARRRSCLAGASAYQPLVFAAAGIAGDGGLLANALPASRPPLVAYADHAIAGVDQGGMAATLTGSSVASLVVSATAAALWHHQADASGPQILGAVHGAGDELSGASDFHCRDPSGIGCAEPPGERGLSVRRVSLCESLARGCSSSLCQQLSCPVWSPGLAETPPLTGTASLSALSALDLTAQESPEEVCAGSAPYFDPLFGSPGDPCPHLQYLGRTRVPWLHPQPGSDPCPNCFYELSQQTLSIEIDPTYQGLLDSPTLLACGTSYNFDGIGSVLSAGDSVQVEDLDLDGCSRATLTFHQVEGGSASSSLLISQ